MNGFQSSQNSFLWYMWQAWLWRLSLRGHPTTFKAISKYIEVYYYYSMTGKP